MKKVVAISVLLTLVMSLLILPNYPALHYYIQKATISNADIDIDNNSLIGDLRYLAAITERANDIEAKTKTTPPPRPKHNNEVNHIVFLLNDNFLNLKTKKFSANYFDFAEKIVIRYIPVNNPPPQS